MSDIISATVFSGVGFVAFVYGKRMGHWTPMLCGLGLMVLPLFLADIALVVTSACLSTAAIIFRHN